MAPPRVALFTDTFEETNGVATLCREFTAFAAARQLPFYCVRGGPRTQLTDDGSNTGGSVSTLELRRSPAAFPIDYDLRCDPLLSRYKTRVTDRVRAFQPDLIHITGPGDFGILGFWVAHTLKVPLVASWHTNLHEYAGRRLEKMFAMLPARWRQSAAHFGEDRCLAALLRFYRLPRFSMAPNETMLELLRARTGKPAFLMPHGVDTSRFTPARRRAPAHPFTIGYVGRLTSEKSVRVFVDLEQRLLAAGRRDFRLLLIGEGGDRAWLARHLEHADLPGILRGDALADAFADMDAFVFPSDTDTFGLVLLEAMASGVPVVLSPAAGGRVGVQDGLTGFFAHDPDGFTQAVLRLMDDDEKRRQMRAAAREFACAQSWSGVFEQVYEIYRAGLSPRAP
jgi:phosphatidylinositol alpha 1,6-mannosyltransferase